MRSAFLLLFLTLTLIAHTQPKKAKPLLPTAPKLIVGIVVDQMRWDYLYRYQSRFSNGGFKRMINEGFNCQNTFIPYVPTYTAPGHTCVYTGSVPNIHGIVGNNWFEKGLNKMVYCTDDDTARTIGSNSSAGKMSPRNMFSNTMCDELRLATNFRGKVIGIALKDRGAILPAGHSANAAYWYDDANESFITSSYYMNDLPLWVKNFNNRRLPDSLIALGWKPLYPMNTYVQSETNEKAYKGNLGASKVNRFPYDFSDAVKNTEDYWNYIRYLPAGNTLTALFAKEAIVKEELGTDEIADFLAVSFSSTDYIGHQFGPNSIENEDDYLRLDKEFESFFTFLDKQVGKGNYTVFLTADHAAAHIPGFLNEHHQESASFDNNTVMNEMNRELKLSTGYDSLVNRITNYQVHLNHTRIKKYMLDADSLLNQVVAYMRQQPMVSHAFDLRTTIQQPMNDKIKTVVANGYYHGRSGDVQLILKPARIDHGNTGTTHGSWNPYDSHIPFLLMGNGIKHGQTYRETYMTDIAATITALLHIQMPNGCVGKVVEEALQ